MDQVVPFHASGSGTPTPAELMYPPTAAQADAERHATPAKVVRKLGIGGVLSTRQVPCRHSSANGPTCSNVYDSPTAVHVVGVAQETPNRTSSPAGMAWTAHVVPFHRSA